LGTGSEYRKRAGDRVNKDISGVLEISLKCKHVLKQWVTVSQGNIELGKITPIIRAGDGFIACS
jgi:hypothetical protein